MRVEGDGEGVVPEQVLLLLGVDPGAEVLSQIHGLGAHAHQHEELGQALGIGAMVRGQRSSQRL